MSYTDAQKTKLQRVSFCLFLIALVIAMMWGLTGCGTFNPPTKNGCVIDGIGYQDALIAQDKLDRNHTWNRLLFVTNGGQRHCLNIFRSKAGVYYWHDARRGSSYLQGITAKSVGNA